MNRTEAVFSLIRDNVSSSPDASINEVKTLYGTPFHILISTIISLRTKDAVTLEASRRLFSRADTPKELASLEADTVASLIYPCGFYSVKASRIIVISRILVEKYHGEVPGTLDELLELPGVGRKTANLTLNLGFGIPAICVDIHVHRISNRLGWVDTRTPEETEAALMEIFPSRYWIELNNVLVRFGQQCCRPRNPRCGSCPAAIHCPKKGVAVVEKQ